VAAIFIYAPLNKIADPPGFAKLVFEYHLLPAAAVNAWALYLPWLELIAGLALLIRPLMRGGAAVTAGLLVLFLLAVGINIARGIPFECGCGGAGGFTVPLVSPVMDFVLSSPSPWVTFVRDLVLLPMTWLVWKAPAKAAQ
jgi:uncharacterized membrane protein YphA (DoxX/SURF4 family)